MEESGKRERGRVGREKAGKRSEEVAYVSPPKGPEPSEVIQTELSSHQKNQSHLKSYR